MDHPNPMGKFWQAGYDWAAKVVENVVAAADRLSTHQWMCLLAVVVAIGFVCLRGFGSRTKY